MRFDFLDEKFLAAMNEIGEYGYRKYGKVPGSFSCDRLEGRRERTIDRVQRDAIITHAKEHLSGFKRGETHDHFGTLRHQLAAAAFNAMMEFYYSGLELEGVTDEQVGHTVSAAR